LQDLLQLHESTDIKNLPVGKLFVIAGCLTEAELRKYISLHKQLRLPQDHHERLGQRLVERGVLTAEQLTIALNDRLQKNISLEDAIVARGFAARDALEESS
jgi:hypothetical protein